MLLIVTHLPSSERNRIPLQEQRTPQQLTPISKSDRNKRFCVQFYTKETNKPKENYRYQCVTHNYGMNKAYN